MSEPASPDPDEIEARIAAMREAKRAKMAAGGHETLKEDEMSAALGEVDAAKEPKYLDDVHETALRVESEGGHPNATDIAQQLNLMDYQVEYAIKVLRKQGRWKWRAARTEKPKPPELQKAIKTLRTNVIAVESAPKKYSASLGAIPMSISVTPMPTDLDEVTTELDAMRSILDAVKVLAPPARQRVLTWASTTLGGEA
jgi:hypothetical protein